jgi:hypothetical protein
MEKKANKVADKYRSDYGAELSYFLFSYSTVSFLMKPPF